MTTHTLYKSIIKGVGSYVPEKIMTNHDLSQVMNTSHKWILERTGISSRHIADINQGTSDLATFAAKNALAVARKDIREIDIIIAATLSPDYFFPGIGVLIQNNLSAKNIPAIDIRAQCSGFSWGLATADMYLRSGNYKTALVVGADIHSKIIEFSDRGRDISVLFGDGAGAAILESSPYRDIQKKPQTSNKIPGIIDHLMGSNGSGAKELFLERPGCAKGQQRYLNPKDTEELSYLPHMNGKHIFKHACEHLTACVRQLCERNKITPEELDLLVPHQANIRINEMVQKKLGLKDSQVINNISKYGNTTSATIPLCLVDAIESKKLKSGSLIMTIAFGSGFTWGANLIRWE